MKGKNIVYLFIALIISGVLVTIIKENTKNTNLPIEGYRVYLEGESIGFIKSREDLEKYINNQQERVKNKYHVDTVYIPNEINIEKEITYDNKIDSVESIYNKINNISPFTIKGYRVTIDRTNSTEYENDENTKDENRKKIIRLNVMNKDLFTKAVESVILSFVDDKQYHAFVNKEKIELQGTGEAVENIYIEDSITIKEANLPVNETIFMDEEALTKYLIFGDNVSNKKYTVKNGDSIEKIATLNNMSVNEVLIANADISSEASLLYVGQEVSVGAVSPIFTTIIEKHVVEDQTIKYKTRYEFDNKMYQGQSKEKQKGSNGINRVTQKVKMINGEISQAYIVSTEELVPMVERVVLKGGKQVPRGDGEWLWPTNIPYILSSRYGYRWGRLHAGIDICGTGRGSPIYSARAGEVVVIGYQAGGYGYYVTIKHDNGYYTRYGHMQNVNRNDKGGLQGSATKYISVGQRVEAHQVIGEMGSSGSSTGVHLHFEIWDGEPNRSQSYNPLLFY